MQVAEGAMASIPSTIPSPNLTPSTSFHHHSSRNVPFPLRIITRTLSFPSLSSKADVFLLNPNLNLPTSAAPVCASAGGGALNAPLHGEVEEAEARGAVVELLGEAGVPVEDAEEIAGKCPRYVEMLVRNVRELDEHSLWSSWEGKGGEKEEISGLGFGKKVYRMAKRKGDGGIFPFLESVGVSRSYSTHIAGYLSSEGLPDLITKVKYIKEILLCGSGNEVLIGRNARRMMLQLSIPIDEDIQQTLSFFEKMEARRGGLEMLGFADTSFACLIESFPRILLCSINNHLKPLLEFLYAIGVSEEGAKSILLLFPPIIFFDIDNDLKSKMHSLQKAGVEDKGFGKMLLKYPWILSSSIQGNYKEIYTFFQAEKVPRSSIDRAIRSWPHLLGCSIDKIKLMVNQLGEFGAKNKTLATIVTSSPQLLLRKPSEFLQVVHFLEEIGFEDDVITRILCRCPEIFASNVEITLKKKISVLIDFGIKHKHLPRVIKKYPELLVSNVHETLLSRMRYLMEIGLSKNEVCSMLYRFSPLLGYSINIVLKPKLEFLLRIMEKPLEELVEYPRYFSYSLEKKIRPRYYVLKGRNIQCSLKEMLGKNDEEFAEEYMGIGRMLVLPLTSSTPVEPSDGRG